MAPSYRSRGEPARERNAKGAFPACEPEEASSRGFSVGRRGRFELEFIVDEEGREQNPPGLKPLPYLKDNRVYIDENDGSEKPWDL